MPQEPQVTNPRRAALTGLLAAAAAAALNGVLPPQAADAAVRQPAAGAVRRRPRKPVARKPVARQPVARKPVVRRPSTGKPAAPAPAPAALPAGPAAPPASSSPAPALTGAPRLPADRAFALHLLRRATFGLTAASVDDLDAAGGPQGWLDQQLAPDDGPDPVVDAVLPRFPLAWADPPTLHARLSLGGWEAMVDLVRATFARQAWSRWQLREVMVDLWSNHLNITCPSSEPWAARGAYDRDVVRAHALGRFDDMLAAAVRHPAMLLYLNGAQSRKEAPNENHGRELLELHTVGVGAGYGQAGVVDAARALTGHTVWFPWEDGAAGDLGTLRYRPEWHWTGPLRVLDWTHPNAGPADGPAVVESLARYLAAHPATARRICTAIAVRFVSDAPPPALVDRLVAAYLGAGTSVVPVLRVLFASPEFAASVGQKARRPAEDVLAAVRMLGVRPDPASSDPEAVADLCWGLQDMGNAPLGWHPPNGYPDVAAAWAGAGTTLARWNAHLGLAQGWWTKGLLYADLRSHLLGGALPATRGALVAALGERLLPGLGLPEAHHAALVAFLGPEGPLGEGDATWLLPVLVALVLDSPGWSVR